MLALDDSRWTELISGYRVKYDARPLLRRFATGENASACWEEVWNQLHHQGDVDTASYAVLPHLIQSARRQPRDWNLYGYAAALLLEAGRRRNPPVPKYLQPGFDAAIQDVFDLAIADLHAGVAPMTLRVILEFLAIHGQAPELGRAIRDIDYFEEYGARVLEAERNGRN
jgi:hypothetical protein